MINKFLSRKTLRAFAAVVVACAMLIFAGCASSNDSRADSGDDKLGKVLVAYYSATGITQAVAEQIANELDAETFKIDPVDSYTEADLDYHNLESKVSLEHVDPRLREIDLVQVTPENFDSYDTVILGYPIWWSIAAWPVDGFVSGNDFSGKTVIPFCTSTTSDIGDSAIELEKLTKTGTWLEGMRFSDKIDPEAITEWVSSLK